MQKVIRILSDFHSLAEDAISGIITNDLQLYDQIKPLSEKLQKALSEVDREKVKEKVIKEIDIDAQ